MALNQTRQETIPKCANQFWYWHSLTIRSLFLDDKMRTLLFTYSMLLSHVSYASYFRVRISLITMNRCGKAFTKWQMSNSKVFYQWESPIFLDGLTKALLGRFTLKILSYGHSALSMSYKLNLLANFKNIISKSTFFKFILNNLKGIK